MGTGQLYAKKNPHTLFLPPLFNKVAELRTYTENFSLLVLPTAGPEGSADRLYRSNPWFVYIAK